MTSHAIDTTVQETDLWTDYVSARAFADECQRMYDEAWCAYIRSGMQDSAKGAEWDQFSVMWRTARERANTTFEAWARVAYPLYDIPMPEEGIESSLSNKGAQ
jgi:hypothetical protein